MRARKFVTRIPNDWILVQRRLISINGFLSAKYFFCMYNFVHWHRALLRIVVINFLCAAHAFYFHFNCVCSFANCTKKFHRTVCINVSVSVNLETVSHSLFSCSFNGWLRCEWVKKGERGKNNTTVNLYAQNDKLIVYCFWLRKWLLRCDAWLTTIILWNVHNSILLFFLLFLSLSLVFLACISWCAISN